MFLTFSLLDRGGLVGKAWVCVSFGTQVTTSRTGLRVLSIDTASFLGCVSAAVSTVGRSQRKELAVWTDKVKVSDRHMIDITSLLRLRVNKGVYDHYLRLKRSRRLFCVR